MGGWWGEESKEGKGFCWGKKKYGGGEFEASRNKSFVEGQHGSLMFGQSGQNSKKTNNNESNGCYNNTNYTSKIPNTPQTMKRSQSAFGLRNKKTTESSKNTNTHQ